MKKAIAVATSVASSTRGCSVLAALRAQVNCVHPHHTIQKMSRARAIVSAEMPSAKMCTTWVTENTNTRSKNSSTKVTRWSCGEARESGSVMGSRRRFERLPSGPKSVDFE
jgi:hypothetical protein